MMMTAMLVTRSGRQLVLRQMIYRPMSKKRFVNVVLLKDLDLRGLRGEVISVKPGYARNYLVPKRTAVYATPENQERYVVNRTEHEKTALLLQRDYMMFKRRAAERPVIFARKVAELGESTLETPITKDDIVRAIRKQLRKQTSQEDIEMGPGQEIRAVGERLINVRVDVIEALGKIISEGAKQTRPPAEQNRVTASTEMRRSEKQQDHANTQPQEINTMTEASAQATGEGEGISAPNQQDKVRATAEAAQRYMQMRQEARTEQEKPRKSERVPIRVVVKREELKTTAKGGFTQEDIQEAMNLADNER